jgi:VWFA-related protein
MHHQGLPRLALLTSVLLLAAGVVRPVGRQSQQTPPARTLAAGAVSMTVDFLALTRDNQPVLDLRPEEVILKVDGKTRALRSLALMSVGAGSDTSSRPASEPPPAPFATNDISDGGRAFVLMIDDETIRVGNEQPVRDAVSHFLTGLSSRDRVAIVTLPHGGLKVDFTSDRTRVRQALQQITGQSNDRETAMDAAVRTRTTLQQLTGWLENLGGGQGPTTVVLFSSSLMGVRGSIGGMGRASAGSAVDSVNMGQIRQEDFNYVGEAAAAAHVQFYVVQHDSMIASAPAAAASSASSTDSNNTRAGLENLASVTGGVLLSLAGSGGDTALTRIARETSAYWAATFDAESNERNGINHLLSLKVSRDGVTVRVRPTLPIAKPDSSAARPSPTSPHAMLLESRTYRELPIRVVSYASRNSDGQIKIVAVAEAVDPGVTLAAAEAGLFDDAGHLLKQWAPLPSDLGSNRVIGAFSGITKGNYRLRFAATDAAGHRGTADCEVAAELVSAGTMKLSDLVLGLSREGRFMPRLQFGSEPVALAYLDMYGGQAGQKIVVMIEVSTTLNGPAFLAVQPAVDATSEPDRFNVTAAIPLGALPAGDYVIRALVNLEGQPEGRVVRTLRKLRL